MDTIGLDLHKRESQSCIGRDRKWEKGSRRVTKGLPCITPTRYRVADHDSSRSRAGGRVIKRR